MNSDLIAEKYANALFEVAVAAEMITPISLEMESATKIFCEKTTLEFFTNPFNSLDQKLAAAKSSLEGKVSAEVFNFISTLVKNERIHLISEINRLYKAKASQVGGVAEGTVYVVDQPSAEFKTALEKKISDLLKKEVRLKIQTDKTLIAGFKVQIEGWTLDDSARHHLKKLTEIISARGL